MAERQSGIGGKAIPCGTMEERRRSLSGIQQRVLQRNRPAIFSCQVELYAPSKKIPFDWLIDFDSLNTRDVLEIGVGNGSHAQLLAETREVFHGN